MLLHLKARQGCLEDELVCNRCKLDDCTGPHWGRSKEQRSIEELEGNIQAKTKPEDNLDQSKVCWQSPRVNEKHLAYKKH